MPHPYQTAPEQAFWRKGVAAEHGEDFSKIFAPKFRLDRNDAIATAGSCFAQHIGRALTASGCTVLDAEPAPRHLSPETAKAFGFGIYSGRYGNIYTARQLRELLEEILSDAPVAPISWQLDAAWVDALRPSVEPEGLSSPLEVAIHRKEHLAALKSMLPRCSLFVFTLGMTEAWQDRSNGRTLPICPGVIAGSYSEEDTVFVNYRYSEVVEDLDHIRRLLQHFNAEMRLLLTVSPVPLTATASGRHVLSATCRSKATLRAAAEDFADGFPDVDYFPSYEIVTSPAARSARFQPNLREVRPEAVADVMSVFLRAYGLNTSDAHLVKSQPTEQYDPGEPDTDLVCEEALLNAFAPT